MDTTIPEAAIIKGNKMKVNSMNLFFMMVLIFLIKAWLVQWSYNYIMPKLTYNMGNKTNDFRKLSYMESIVVVILFNNLLSNLNNEMEKKSKFKSTASPLRKCTVTSFSTYGCSASGLCVCISSHNSSLLRSLIQPSFLFLK